MNGLKQIGNKKMDLIDYTLYQGIGELTDLYWQQEDLPVCLQRRPVIGV